MKIWATIQFKQNYELLSWQRAKEFYLKGAEIISVKTVPKYHFRDRSDPHETDIEIGFVINVVYTFNEERT